MEEKARKKRTATFWVVSYIISVLSIAIMPYDILFAMEEIVNFYLIPYFVAILILPIFCFNKKIERGRFALRGILLSVLCFPIEVWCFIGITFVTGTVYFA